MTSLEPRLPSEGRVLEFDFPGLEIGLAEYDEGPTGCTVFHFPRGVAFAADVRGGSPGTIGVDYGWAHAFCFAGGSLMGLEAASGVAAELFARRGHEHVDWNDVPLVAGAIIFDFGARRNGVYPDKALGAAALRAARPGVFLLGPRGAGRMAAAGKAVAFDQAEPAGQGAAFRQYRGLKMAVFTVVNALGAVYDRQGNIVRGNRDRASGKRLSLVAEAEQSLLGLGGPAAPPSGNTTLTLALTNARLPGRTLAQLARQVHASMARAVQPFHTDHDGDVLFMAATNEVDSPLAAMGGALGALISEVAWDAVLASWDPDEPTAAPPRG
ncbi:MAG TPA: P1 family peptidase [Dehalococcoidia bacterium]|nr:P1 family peptidase [Dehalococcoidia bacterium]